VEGGDSGGGSGVGRGRHGREQGEEGDCPPRWSVNAEDAKDATYWERGIVSPSKWKNPECG